MIVTHFQINIYKDASILLYFYVIYMYKKRKNFKKYYINLCDVSFLTEKLLGKKRKVQSCFSSVHTARGKYGSIMNSFDKKNDIFS